jgi:hypothetical protein
MPAPIGPTSGSPAHQEVRMATDTTHPPSPFANASFRAKSTGVSLVLTFAVGAYYVANAIGLGALVGPGTPVPDEATTLAFATLGLFVFLQIVLQAVLAIGAGPVAALAAADRRAAATGRRAAYPVLVAGALATFAAAFLGASPFGLANLALVGFVVAELVRFTGELLAYRPRS